MLMCVCTVLRVSLCECVKGRNGATQRQPCKESSLCQLWLLLDPSGCNGDCGEQLEERHLSSCSCLLPLICLTLLLFLSSPWAISYCTPLSIWSIVATAGVCVYVPETRIKLLFIVFEQEIISNVSPHSLFSPLLFITLLWRHKTQYFPLMVPKGSVSACVDWWPNAAFAYM